jgi:hypothetical protein
MGVPVMKKMRILILLFFSLTFLKAQVQNVCISCHSELEDELARPVEEWRNSIHASNGVSCQHCHGGNASNEDKAMEEEEGFVGVPSKEEIPIFCGKCHVAVKENYLKSPHGTAHRNETEAPTCVTCHTAHSQKRATLDLINEELCGSCHSYERAEKIRFAMASTENKINSLRERAKRVWRRGFKIKREEDALFAVRNAFHQLTHVLDVDKILTETGNIVFDLSRIEKQILEKEMAIERRKKAGIILVAFFLFAAYIFHLYRKSL